MPDDPALLQTIIDQPDDDAPRLIYADWLEEHGDPTRAEFIRVQCELARLPVAQQIRSSLYVRQSELLRRHESDWLGTLPVFCRKLLFWRGFVNYAWTTGDVFLLHGTHIFRENPIVDLRLDAIQPGTMAYIVASPLLGRLQRLDVSQFGLPSDAVRALVQSLHLESLRVLQFEPYFPTPFHLNRFYDEAARSALQTRFGARLRT